MNKPITMIIKETKSKLVDVCNESGLSPAILDLVIQGIYSEVHALAEKQALEEESIYAMMAQNADIQDNNVDSE